MKDKLPANWEWKTLREIALFRRGSFPQPYGSKEWYDGEDSMPFVQVADVNKDMGLVKITNQRISKLAQSKSVFVPKGTVIISIQGSIGRVAITQYDSYVDRTIAIFEKFFIDLDKKFFAFQLKRKFEYEKDYARGATLKTITKEEFAKFTLPVPPVAEQKQIVALLEKSISKINQAITLVYENIEKIKQLDESAFSQVFEKLLRDKVTKKKLVDIADVRRGKSKHRPRNDKKMYDGDYPLIQTGDIRNAGKFITQFSQTYNEIGLAQSKLWAKGTVCLTIAANIGDVAILGIDACFPDSVVGIHSKTEDNIYIYYFLKSIKKQLDDKSSASAQKNLSVEKLSDFYIPIPSLAKQQQIVSHLDQLTEKTNKLLQHYQNKLEALQKLKNSVLESAFKGEFKKDNVLVLADPYIERKKQLSAKKNADKQAMVIALSIEAHNKLGKSLYRTKGEKTVELIEKHIGLEFGREAKKLAAGPASFQHLVKVVEPLAKTHKWFNVQEIKGDNFDSHKYIQGENFNPFLLRAVKELQSNLPEIRRVISLFANLKTTHEAEVYATTYAGWNNLIIRKLNPDDEAIVTEARENWHEAKLKIERSEFFDAIKWLRNNNLVPKGNGKEVD